MILALDKHGALYVFSSTTDAERELEAIDVREGEFEFCDVAGQRFAVAYTILPKVSGRAPLRSVIIGAFRLAPEGDVDSTLPDRFIGRAAHIEHTSIPGITSLQVLRYEVQMQR